MPTFLETKIANISVNDNCQHFRNLELPTFLEHFWKVLPPDLLIPRGFFWALSDTACHNTLRPHNLCQRTQSFLCTLRLTPERSSRAIKYEYSRHFRQTSSFRVGSFWHCRILHVIILSAHTLCVNLLCHSYVLSAGRQNDFFVQ